MNWKKRAFVFFTPIVLFLSASTAFAQQAPNITYSSVAFVWYVGVPVSEAPTNTGGGPTNGYFAYLIAGGYIGVNGQSYLLPGITFNIATGVISGTCAGYAKPSWQSGHSIRSYYW